MRKTLFSLGLCLCIAGCGDSFDTKRVQETLHALNEEGVVYSGTLEGPTEAGFELFSGGRATTGGWVSLRLQSPVANPLARTDSDADGNETPTEPVDETPSN